MKRAEIVLISALIPDDFYVLNWLCITRKSNLKLMIKSMLKISRRILNVSNVLLNCYADYVIYTHKTIRSHKTCNYRRDTCAWITIFLYSARIKIRFSKFLAIAFSRYNNEIAIKIDIQILYGRLFEKKCPPFAIRFRWMLMVAKFILRLMKHGWSRSQFRRKDLLASVRTWHSGFYLTVSSCASFIFIYPRLTLQ